MLNLKNDFVKPFDDEKMKYIFADHRYVLEIDHQQFETGINLSLVWGGIDNALLYLELVSDVCYTFVAKFKDSKYFHRLLYYMAHSKEMRRAINELMLDTVRYNHEDGGFMIAYQSGVNLHEMKELRLKIENAVSVVGDKIVKNFGLQQRLNNFNINEMTYFEDLQEVLDYLFSQSLITEETYDFAEDINDIPYDYRYRVFVNPKGEYVYENMRTFENAMEQFGVEW